MRTDNERVFDMTGSLALDSRKVDELTRRLLVAPDTLIFRMRPSRFWQPV
jgi:hypothetical protein